MVVMQDINDAKSTNTLLDNGYQTNKTFVQALKHKYVDQEDFVNQSILPKDKSISTDITFVGFDKVSEVQRQLKRLTNIDLSYRQIKLAGDLDSIKGSLNKVTVLNLAGNQLNWQEVVSILTCLPNLREIILTGNDLDVKNIHNLSESPKYSLTSLTLGRINQDWNSVINVLARIWVQIEQIDLWDNGLHKDNIRVPDFARLTNFIGGMKVLKLSQNCFPDLSWINSVGPIDKLTDLDISRCQLETIEFDTIALGKLQNLRILNISYNNINSWISISNLNCLKSLQSIICQENPIFITEKLGKFFTIARLARIEKFNKEEVTTNLRRESEIIYLRKVFPEYQQFKEAKNDSFVKLHPRYDELAEIYGLPEDLKKKQTVDKYITVDLCLDDKQFTKKLPCDMRISNLQMLCKRLFRLSPSCNIEIICCEPESVINYPLDKEGQTLDFFCVKNNQKLLIKQLG